MYSITEQVYFIRKAMCNRTGYEMQMSKCSSLQTIHNGKSVLSFKELLENKS